MFPSSGSLVSMARTDQQRLDDLDAAIEARELGDAFDGYSTNITQWRGAPLADLYAERDRLIRRIHGSGARVIRASGPS